MKNCLKIVSFITSFFAINLLSVTPALAAAPDGMGPWADTVLSSSQGLMKNGLAVPAARSNPSSALGVAENNTTEGNFYSLGFGGSLSLGFDNGISSGVIVVEATNPGYPDEKAKVEVSENGTNWVNAGTVTADGQVNKPAGITCARYVRLTDVSDPNNFSDDTADGYDVDGVKASGDPCSPPTNGGGSCTCGSSSVTQTNNTTVNTTVISGANSGGNKTNFNTGGVNVITSGSASSNVAVVTTGSSNTTSNPCCCTGGGNNVSIVGNGAGSVNTVNIGTKKPSPTPFVFKKK